MSAGNPFELDGNWYKGALHLHTTNSDGRLSPEEVIEFYKNRNYNFLAITDHNKVSKVSESSSRDFLLLNGVELGIGSTQVGDCYHILAINIEKDFKLPETLSPDEAVEFIEEKGGEVILCHPYWSGLTINDMLNLHGYGIVEIYNYSCELGIGKGCSTVHWDDLLIHRKAIWGVAVDDAHFDVPDGDGGWVMVKAKTLSKKAIMESLRHGYFYSSSGPQIFDFRVSEGIVSVKCSEASTITFFCDLSKGKQFRAQGNSLLTYAQFKLGGKEEYVRVECKDIQGNCAWTNPIALG